MSRSLPLALAVCGAALLLSTGLAVLGGCGAPERNISRDALAEDVERLAWIIVDAHPAPYERCGGKDAFDARLAQLIDSIPEEGMTRQAFGRHLIPFMAFIGDAHTEINVDLKSDWSKPGGVPLYFGVVGSELYVRGVTREEERRLIGARLLSVEGVPAAEIIERMGSLRPVENEYGALAWLAAYGGLWFEANLSMLLPEWSEHSSVTVKLSLADDTEETLAFHLPRKVDYPPIVPESAVTLPSTERCEFVYSFLDPERSVALLRVTGMMHYREALEMWESYGQEDMRSYGREAYKAFHGTAPPSDYAEVMAGVPSATETFRDLVTEMKEAGTRTLLVDLTRNSGGNSFMSNMLVYFL